ncbi:4-hydroxythreonine-4-phosphate dehydrogenase PdxA [uncultured Acetobacteroides sp.]|uniref:4-hydroxythreonine-4-phosphate dehydrogenase PdxA n=1 Tax=uncultured Acetobacteroides sp. TaxID=1760811 RepID=UPI0029F45E76|nr:4-hydroxythreonine-4-phosphate dehydrogenase PdxA [uncultured Acetobacteroides sp.]
MIDGKVVIGITQGDINGIGYEVIMKTLADTRINEICIPVVYGSPKVAAFHRKLINVENFSFNPAKSIEDIHPKRSNMINVMDDNVRVDAGKSTPMGGAGAVTALDIATQDLMDGKIDVLVTAPINKQNVQSEEFTFPGHTEYLEKRFNSQSLMIMISDILKIGVVTTHVPIKDLPFLISKELILAKLRTLNESLVVDFAVRGPRIAVLGLNPHAGDSGLIGIEENEVIIPAINAANEEGIMAFGPYPADGFFGSDSFRKFDAVLAMYHDQGLIPFKVTSFGSGVNYTAGLPVIRTSPAHGTAYNLVGQDIASPDSFRSAIYAAIDIFRNRSMYHEISKNPLPHVDPDSI